MNELAARGQSYGGLLQAAAIDASSDPEVSANSYTAAHILLGGTFAPKLGYGDAQYNDVVGGVVDYGYAAAGKVLNPLLEEFGYRPIDLHYFIDAFTNAGNFGIGVFYQNAGLPLNDALQTFGIANQIEGGRVSQYSTSAPYGNSLWGFTEINAGYAAAVNASAIVANVPPASAITGTSYGGNAWQQPVTSPWQSAVTLNDIYGYPNTAQNAGFPSPNVAFNGGSIPSIPYLDQMPAFAPPAWPDSTAGLATEPGNLTGSSNLLYGADNPYSATTGTSYIGNSGEGIATAPVGVSPITPVMPFPQHLSRPVRPILVPLQTGPSPTNSQTSLSSLILPVTASTSRS